jgi:hypothetical protein
MVISMRAATTTTPTLVAMALVARAVSNKTISWVVSLRKQHVLLGMSSGGLGADACRKLTSASLI